MSNYEKEMFQFLTTEENLKGLIIAKNHFPLVKEKLLHNFWNQVYVNIQLGIKAHENWEVKRDGNLTKWNSKIYIKERDDHIFENGFPSMIFCWERLMVDYPYFCFWYNEDYNEYDSRLSKDYIARCKQSNFQDFEGPINWFFLWKGDEKINFSNDNGLFHITPELYLDKAKEFSDAIIDLFANCIDHYYFIKDNFRK